jgi:ketosteroid isomerase-like protein
MSMRRILLYSVVLCAIGACSSSHFDASSARAALLRRDADWSEVSSAGKDVDKIASYWSDDALVIFPGQPAIEGKAALRAFVSTSLATPGFSIHWRSEKPEFSPDGKLAYMHGTTEMTIPGADGKPATVHLRGLTVWRMEPDGEWRCVADVANEAPPTAPSAS